MEENHVEGYPRNYIKQPISDIISSSIPVRLMQWNILAQGFIPLDEFIHCSQFHLSLNTRSRQIADEISRFQPDFACLQEVDIADEILTCLSEKEPLYKIEFLPKAFSPCTLIENNHGPDGSAIIYRSDNFDLIQTNHISLDDKGNRKALHCIFRPRKIPTGFTFSNIHVICLHLKAKVHFSKARHEQGLQLCAYLCQLVDKCTDRQLSPIFICGDFNAEPHEPVIELLKQFSSNHDPVLRFSSAYAVANEDQEPEFTTWKFRQSERVGSKVEEKHTIDYIWYSKQLSSLTGVWSIPNENVIGPKGLPSIKFPSDHMNLIADFVIPLCT